MSHVIRIPDVEVSKVKILATNSMLGIKIKDFQPLTL